MSALYRNLFSLESFSYKTFNTIITHFAILKFVYSKRHWLQCAFSTRWYYEYYGASYIELRFVVVNGNRLAYLFHLNYFDLYKDAGVFEI